jgi:hypothetical protein
MAGRRFCMVNPREGREGIDAKGLTGAEKRG